MLSLSFRIAGGTRWSGERRFAYAQDDFTFIRHMKSLFAQGLSETTSPRRLKSVSIMLHNIARPYDVSYDLFESGVDMTNIAARNQIMTVMDNLNAKYRRSVLHVGARAKIPGGYAGAKIAFGRIPDKEDFY